MNFIAAAWQRHIESSTSAIIIATSAAITTATLYAIFQRTMTSSNPKIIPSPLGTVLPKLSSNAVSALDYQPDAFPGARDVSTPYGSMRVYEFGPETGRKVLLIHGITTSCQTLTYLARDLADRRGRRVMLFDLWGRGFSDGVGDLPHDARLYASQALLALASSPLPWTGAAAFDLVGYSMGGGIAVNFAAAFPALVRTLVLLAPAGLIPEASFGRTARFLFQGGLVPERLLVFLTRRRLRKPLSSRARKTVDPAEAALPEGVEAFQLADAEVLPDGTTPDGDPTSLESRVARYLQWMLDNHPGFVPAFISCTRYAPLFGQEDAYRALAKRPARTVCVVLGREDHLVHPSYFEKNALPLLGGREQVPDVVIVKGGHHIPMTHSREVLAAMYRFWGEEQT